MWREPISTKRQKCQTIGECYLLSDTFFCLYARCTNLTGAILPPARFQTEGQSQRTAKEYCTLLSESSVFAFQNRCQSGCEPSKILTRLRVSFRANFGRNWWVLPRCDDKCESQKSAFSVEFMEFCSKILQRQRKKRRKKPCFRAKTSGFFATNFRTFHDKHP